MDPNAANTASFSNARSIDMLGNPFPVALGTVYTDQISMDTAVGEISNTTGSLIVSANGVLSLLGTEIDCTSTKLTNVGTPTASTDAATKGYVDAADALKANLSGATFSGAVSAGSNKIVSSAVPTSGSDLCNKTYVDAADALKLSLSGGTMSGALNMNGQDVNNVNSVTTTSFVTRNLVVGSNAILLQGTSVSSQAAEQWINFRRGGGQNANAGIILSSFSSSHYFLYNSGSSLILSYSTEATDSPLASNGTTLLSSSTSGVLTFPGNARAIRRKGNPQQSVSSGTAVEINDWEISVSLVDITHSAGVFTLPTAGRYMITWTIGCVTGNAGNIETWAFQNAVATSSTAVKYGWVTRVAGATEGVRISSTTVMDIAANDNVRIVVFQNTGLAINFPQATTSSNNMQVSIVKIG